MKNIYALLVGINDYPKDKLNGCWNDVKTVEKYIKQYYVEKNGYEIKQIVKLLDNEANRSGIIAGFKNAFSNAANGDICLFYYSGHGSYFKCPDDIYNHGEAECQSLVCWHEKQENRNDLADKELGALIYEACKDKNLHFVVITDCCHAGTITRGNEKASRNFSNGEYTYLDTNKYFGKSYATQNGEGKWQFPQAKYIHIAACTNSQQAIEKKVTGEKLNGVFTHSLVDILTSSSGFINYNDLISRLKLYINGLGETQTPLLHIHNNSIAGTFQFLNSDKELEDEPAIIKCTTDGWLLNKGQFHGYKKGNKVRLSSGGLATYDAKISEAGFDKSKLEINNTNLNESKKYDVIVSLENQLDIKVANTELLNYFKTLSNFNKLKYIVLGDVDDGYSIENTSSACFKLLYTKAGQTNVQLQVEYTEGTKEEKARLFVDYVDKFCKHQFYWNFEGTGAKPKYELTVEVKDDDRDTLTQVDIKTPIAVNYKNEYPEFTVKLKNETNGLLYITSAYLGCLYDISTDLFEDATLQPNEERHLEVKTQLLAESTHVCPLAVNDNLPQWIGNRDTITEQLKIFISTEQIQLTGMAQEGIDTERSRPSGSSIEARGNKEKWVVQTIEFEITKTA